MANRLFLEAWRPVYAGHVLFSTTAGCHDPEVVAVAPRVLVLSFFEGPRLVEVLLTAADARRLASMLLDVAPPGSESVLTPTPGDVGTPVDRGSPSVRSALASELRAKRER